MTSLRHKRRRQKRALIRVKVNSIGIQMRTDIRVSIGVSLIETLLVEGYHDFNTQVGVVEDMARGAPLIK